MKTTLDLPDDLFRLGKATAALRGMSLKELFTAALRAYLQPSSLDSLEPRGWRAVFGKAPAGATAEVDAVLVAEFERVDPENWR